MKKEYIEPTVEVVEFEYQTTLLAGSTQGLSIDDDEANDGWAN